MGVSVVWLITDSIAKSHQSTNVYEVNALSKNCGYTNRLVCDCILIDDHTNIEIVIYVIYSIVEQK